MALILALVVFFYAAVQPAAASVLITEVHPNPISGPEWVELYNSSSQSASLAGWQLKDQLSSPSLVFTFANEIMAPLEILVIQLAGTKLNNTADGVTLLDSSGSIQDEMQYENTESGKSWSRKNLTSSVFILTDPNPGIFEQILTDPTPTPPLNQPTPSPSTGLAIIQEFSPCPPTGQQEWVKIYNPGSSNLDLTGWKIKDAQNNSRALAGSLPPQSNNTFSWPASILNNAGDELFLYNASEALIDSAYYEDCTGGQVFVKNGDEWRPMGEAPNSNPANPDMLTLKNSLLTTQAADSPEQNKDQRFLPKNLSPSDFKLSTGAQDSKTHNGRAIFLTSAPNSLTSEVPASVILGGLFVSCAGAIFIYESDKKYQQAKVLD